MRFNAVLNCKLYLKNCTTIKPTLQTAFFTVEMPAAEIAHFQMQPYGKATVILRYNLFVARLIPTKRIRADGILTYSYLNIWRNIFNFTPHLL